MKLGIIGLGRMGYGIAHRVVNAGHEVVGFDQHAESSAAAAQMGVTIAHDSKGLVRECSIIWLMVPITVVDDVIQELLPHLKKGAIVVDGGNSFYKDSMRRAQLLAPKGITYLDCGTSGGISGREIGYCLMVGGDKKGYIAIEPLLKVIASPAGYMYVGPSGAGHYVKMVHNGIEYGMMQAYAEGFQIIKEGSFKAEHIDLAQLSAIWNQSSVIRSFLLGLTHEVFEKDQEFAHISGKVAQGGMGQWTVDEAHAHKIPARVIEEALHTRGWSQKTGGNYATKLLALLRQKFGGHSVNHI